MNNLFVCTTWKLCCMSYDFLLQFSTFENLWNENSRNKIYSRMIYFISRHSQMLVWLSETQFDWWTIRSSRQCVPSQFRHMISHDGYFMWWQYAFQLHQTTADISISVKHRQQRYQIMLTLLSCGRTGISNEKGKKCKKWRVNTNSVGVDSEHKKPLCQYFSVAVVKMWKW